jgi:hypothetical protein
LILKREILEIVERRRVEDGLGKGGRKKKCMD